MTIDEIDGYEEEVSQPEAPQVIEPSFNPMAEQQEQREEEENEDDDSFLIDFLKTRGISDPTRIKFEDDDGKITERHWNDLTKEEQINILNTPLDVPQENVSEDSENTQLTDEEIFLLNEIRKSNLTPSQYLEQVRNTPTEPVYRVDDLSDDELYLLDLESRVGELSEDEAAQALNVAKQNESFYQKQIEGIRKEYKEREDYRNQQEQAELEQQQQAAFEQYQNQVINAIDSFNAIGNLDVNLEDNDKEELAEFMLSQDESGRNYLYQALQDPETLVKAAWFILNGDEALNSVEDYFKGQIKLVSENQYKKGFEDGKKGKSPKFSTVIFSQQNSNKPKSIDDLN